MREKPTVQEKNELKYCNMRQLVDMHNTRHNHLSQSCSSIGISFIIIRNDDVKLQQVCNVVCSMYVCMYVCCCVHGCLGLLQVPDVPSLVQAFILPVS